jgi:hypothetical protein
MRARVPLALLVFAVAATFVPPAHAAISVGQPANPFTKNLLVGSSVGPATSLSDYAGKVKILFVLGFN